MAELSSEKYECEKCHKQMGAINFYTYKDGRKTEMCKKCMTLHIDNFDESTYLWLLEKMDVPYVPSEWKSLRDKAFAKNPNLNGMSVFGKYISKFKLSQWIDPVTKKPYGWADTERLQEKLKCKPNYSEEEAAAREERQKVLQEQFDSGEISEAQYKTLMDVEVQNELYAAAPPTPYIGDTQYNEKQFLDESELQDFAEELTQEDKIYLAMKWGRLYKANEWVELEKQYNEMMESFPIEDADSVNTLKLLCKTNLKANQAIDCGDVDGFQKLSKVADALRKSAKFMAVQNKEDKAGSFDAICEIVVFCEKEGGFIPQHQIEVDYDIADRDIRDMKEYNLSLIREDPTVFKQVEEFIKKRQIMEEQEADLAMAAAKGEPIELSDADLQKYRESIEEQQNIDKEYLEGEDL